MGKKAPKAPPAPDPAATAAAQTASNQTTAWTQARLNNVNQYGPDGSITFQGSNIDPGTGMPTQYSETTTLSPQEQAIYNATRQGQQTYVNAADRQLGNAYDSLSTPFSNPYTGTTAAAAGAAQGALSQAQNAASQPVNTDYNAIRQQAIDAANSRLQPEQNMQEESLRSRLLNSGITEGSDAWNNAYRQFNNSVNDAHQQTLLNAENLAGQSIQQTAALRQIPLQEAGQVGNLAGQVANVGGSGEQQALTAYNEPLNVTSSMLTGQQVATPSYQSVPQTNIAPTDVIGATMGSANIRNQQYAQQMQNYSSGLGGLYGLAGAGILGGSMLLRSDRRAKHDIRRVGKTDEGTPIYTYKYKGDPNKATHMGVMAQELMKKRPAAVKKDATGMYAVNYAQVR